MFSDLTIALITGLSFGVWVYTKILRSTGGNTTNSIIVGLASGVSAVIAVKIILGFVFQ